MKDIDLKYKKEYPYLMALHNMMFHGTSLSAATKSLKLKDNRFQAWFRKNFKYYNITFLRDNLKDLPSMMFSMNGQQVCSDIIIRHIKRTVEILNWSEDENISPSDTALLICLFGLGVKDSCKLVGIEYDAFKTELETKLGFDVVSMLEASGTNLCLREYRADFMCEFVDKSSDFTSIYDLTDKFNERFKILPEEEEDEDMSSENIEEIVKEVNIEEVCPEEFNRALYEHIFGLSTFRLDNSKPFNFEGIINSEGLDALNFNSGISKFKLNRGALANTILNSVTCEKLARGFIETYLFPRDGKFDIVGIHGDRGRNPIISILKPLDGNNDYCNNHHQFMVQQALRQQHPQSSGRPQQRQPNNFSNPRVIIYDSSKHKKSDVLKQFLISYESHAPLNLEIELSEQDASLDLTYLASVWSPLRIHLVDTVKGVVSTSILELNSELDKYVVHGSLDDVEIVASSVNSTRISLKDIL